MIFEVVGQTAYIVTNQHVVENQVNVSVTVEDTIIYDGWVVGVNAVRDLAVLSICCGNFTALTFGDAKDLELGDEVVAIGYALGLEGSATITRGIVSAVRYDWRYGAEVIQTDASINPGNSGGPLLSLDGKVLGINTFKWVEEGVEGVGFAISALTVTQTLPSLQTGGPLPTPLPTSRPVATPTPRPLGAGDWGPVNGELWHNPADDFIKIEYAGVLISDMVVEATFVNPYSSTTNSWDYGFILRSKEYSSFLQFVVSSNRRWEVLTGEEAPYDRLGRGTVNNLRTGTGQKNHLMVVVIGERGWFFVNGEFVADSDLSSVTHFGDVAVITGAYTDDEVAGSVTRYEGFAGRQLTKEYGPATGKLEGQAGGDISVDWSGVWTRDLIMEAEFVNPEGSDWSYGFIIRSPEYNSLEVIVITDAGRWFHYTSGIGDYEYTEIATGRLSGLGSTTPGDRNHLLLIAVRESGWFFLNGRLVTRIDLGHNESEGWIYVVSDFWTTDKGEPEFRDFNVWAP